MPRSESRRHSLADGRTRAHPRQPIPVNLQRKDLKAELGRAISSTYFHPSTGTSQ